MAFSAVTLLKCLSRMAESLASVVAAGSMAAPIGKLAVPKRAANSVLSAGAVAAGGSCGPPLLLLELELLEPTLPPPPPQPASARIAASAMSRIVIAHPFAFSLRILGCAGETCAGFLRGVQIFARGLRELHGCVPGKADRACPFAQ